MCIHVIDLFFVSIVTYGLNIDAFTLFKVQSKSFRIFLPREGESKYFGGRVGCFEGGGIKNLAVRQGGMHPTGHYGNFNSPCQTKKFLTTITNTTS